VDVGSTRVQLSSDSVALTAALKAGWGPARLERKTGRNRRGFRPASRTV